MTKRCIINTEKLPDELKNEIGKLVIASNLFGMSQKDIVKNKNVRDAICYKLKLQDGERIISLNFDDVSVPEKIRPLIKILKEIAFKKSEKL